METGGRSLTLAPPASVRAASGGFGYAEDERGTPEAFGESAGGKRRTTRRHRLAIPTMSHPGGVPEILGMSSTRGTVRDPFRGR